MFPRPPLSTLTDTLFPYASILRAAGHDAVGAAAPARMGEARNVHEPASRRLFPLGRNIVPGGALSRHAGTGREAAKRGEHPPRLCRRESRGDGADDRG